MEIFALHLKRICHFLFLIQKFRIFYPRNNRMKTIVTYKGKRKTVYNISTMAQAYQTSGAQRSHSRIVIRSWKSFYLDEGTGNHLFGQNTEFQGIVLLGYVTLQRLLSPGYLTLQWYLHVSVDDRPVTNPAVFLCSTEKFPFPLVHSPLNSKIFHTINFK